MHTPITPGTLCYMRTKAKQNNGKFVTVRKRDVNTIPGLGPVWWVVSSSPIALFDVYTGGRFTREVCPGVEFRAPERNLVPLAGPGLADEVAAFDKLNPPNHQEEKRAIFAALYGASHARSTPYVRR